ncbi:DUF4041 domain-containing protein [Streptomyces marispadix]|uniref:DUF4041 domain-containing protein n=1 Tax=Streptomyces marispadix TaxID=2922868 RepID=A0ABS9SYW9_9ACTN|nr:DUF4041 domain-containing protein [Streptomyces marispadix]MCH6161486.1 DUF4041 domain-containing protein [Streptomyces marispadix]
MDRLTGELRRLQAEHAQQGAEKAALHQQLSRVQGEEAATLIVDTERLRASYQEADELLLAKIDRASDQLHQALADEQHAYDDLVRRVADVQAETTRTQQRLDQLRGQVVHTEEAAMLQEAGIYEYRHPLADAVAYKSELSSLKDRIKTLARRNGAVLAATDWHVNGSLTEGKKMVRDFSKLMLRAYNAEADNAVRTMRPHRLASLIDRLEKSRQTIARLGATMHILISDEYHRLRVRELELTADHLAKQEEEKERRRELREQQREEERLQKELERERSRLDKERRHYQSALDRLRASGSGHEAGAAESRDKLAEIESSLAAVDAREANIRAGYVYVISNLGAFGERMVKIGMTRRLEPMDRVNELGDASVPFRFDVHALIFSEDAVGLERKLHEEFEDRRVNRVNLRREFFYVRPAEVREALQRFAGQHLIEFREDSEAPEWRASTASQERGTLAAAGEAARHGEDS